MQGRTFSGLVLFLCIFISQSLLGEVFVQKSSFIYGEKMESVIRVSERGWYSLQVESATGAGIMVMDRMSGVLKSHGRKGESDGRIDLLLEAGEYKVFLDAPELADSPVVLKVVPFVEKSEPAGENRLPFINDGDSLAAALNDLETRSFWVQVGDERELRLEILSRNLVDCTILRDGLWLEPVKPRREVYEPVEGQPMLFMEYYNSLNPGLYLVQCAGGPAREWTADSDENPFYIRRGASYIGEADYRELTVSPFGRDSFLVSGKTNFIQLIRSKKKPSVLSARNYELFTSRFYGLRSSQITEKSEDPWCSLSLRTSSRNKWVIVHGKPGDKMRLIYFNQSDTRYFGDEEIGRDFWISGFSSIEGANSIDITPVLSEGYSGVTKEEFIHISQKEPLVRKVNLLSSFNFYLFVDDPGTYKILEKEGAASGRYSFDLLTDDVRGKRFKPGEDILLTRGVYLISISPEKKGILDFIIYHDSLGDPAGVLASQVEMSPPAFVWPRVNIPGKRNLLVNRRGIAQTMIVRPLPLNLEEHLPFELEGGGQVSVNFEVKALSLLSVSGEAFSLMLDGEAFEAPGQVDPGIYDLSFKNTGEERAFFSLFTEKIVEPPAPIKVDVIPPDEAYPVLKEDSPLFDDYKREDSRFFLLKVETPAFYRLETSGRMDMGIKARTYFKPALFADTSEGVGRNGLIQRYFKKGEYLVEVYTRGRSMGRAGIHMNRISLISGGVLEPESLYRNSVPANQALMFSFKVESRGDYALKTFGPGQSFKYRLDDKDGWPVVLEGSGFLGDTLGAGEYIYYSMPENFPTRRITSFMADKQEVDEDSYKLAVNRVKKNLWEERSPRTPDVYKLSISAYVEGEFFLTGGMAGELVSPAGEKLPLFQKDSLLKLSPGEYEVHLRSVDKNNRLPYEIGFFTSYLIPGIHQRITTYPALLKVSVPESKIINLWNLGGVDLKAELWDNEEKHLLAESDDYVSDWNFRIIRKVFAGTYTLKVFRVGKSGGETSVYLDMIDEMVKPEETLPFTLKESVGSQVVKVPFKMGSGEGLVHFRAANKEPVTLAVYRGNYLLGQAMNEIYIPLKGNSFYSIHLWHQENKPLEVDFRSRLFSPENLFYENVKRIHPIVQCTRVINSKGGSFFFPREGEFLLFSPGLEIPCSPVNGKIMSTVGDSGWLMNLKDESFEAVISPVYLKPGEGVNMDLSDSEQSFMISHYSNDVLLLEAESIGNPVGLMVESEDSYNRDVHNWRGMVFAGDRTIVGIPEKGEFQGKLWSIADGKRNISPGVTLKSFKLQNKIAFKEKRSVSYMIEAGKALTLELPEKTLELRLTLAKGLTAFGWKSGIPLGIVSASGENIEAKMVMEGGILSIVNSGKKSSMVKIDSIAAASGDALEPVLTASFEKLFDSVGNSAFRVLSGSEKYLYLYGESFSSVIRGDDGKLYKGAPVAREKYLWRYPLVDGILEVSYGPGILRIWPSSSQDFAVGLLGITKEKDSVPVMESAAKLSSSPFRRRLEIDKPGYVSLSADSPGFLALLKEDSVIAYRVTGRKGDRKLFYYLDKGSYTLFARPVKGSYEGGALFYKVLDPIPLVEGEEARYFISPGEKQVFRFEVQVPGKVGVGLKGENDDIEAALFNTVFDALGKGRLIFEELKTGSYFVVVSGKDKPVQYTPVVMGTMGSVGEIPEDVLESFKNK